MFNVQSLMFDVGLTHFRRHFDRNTRSGSGGCEVEKSARYDGCVDYRFLHSTCSAAASNAPVGMTVGGICSADAPHVSVGMTMGGICFRSA